MTRQHDAVMHWLSLHVGEHEVPMGSNTGPFVRACQAATWLAGTRWPWCVALWVKAWTVAGRKLPYRGAGAYSTLAWYSSHLPGWVVPLSRAKPGAGVCLNIGAGHWATLATAYDGKGIVHTIDGNWRNAVQRVPHRASQVRGCVDPPETTAKPPAAKPPQFELVTSASGHSKVVFVGGANAVSRKLAVLLTRFGGLTVRRHKQAAAEGKE